MREMLANVVMWLHVAVVVELLIGIVYWPFGRTTWHMSVLTATVVSQAVFLGCPLVVLESALRGRNVYQGSFTCWLLYRLFGIAVPPLAITACLAAALMISALAWKAARA